MSIKRITADTAFEKGDRRFWVGFCQLIEKNSATRLYYRKKRIR
jgi:hypothetical protein